MLIVIAIAAGAALTVIAYNKVRDQDPDLANASMRRVHQLAAVIVVLTSAIEKTFDALQIGVRTSTTYASYRAPRPLADLDWDDE